MLKARSCVLCGAGGTSQLQPDGVCWTSAKSEHTLVWNVCVCLCVCVVVVVNGTVCFQHQYNEKSHQALLKCLCGGIYGEADRNQNDCTVKFVPSTNKSQKRWDKGGKQDNVHSSMVKLAAFIACRLCLGQVSGHLDILRLKVLTMKLTEHLTKPH